MINHEAVCSATCCGCERGFFASGVCPHGVNAARVLCRYSIVSHEEIRKERLKGELNRRVLIF